MGLPGIPNDFSLRRVLPNIPWVFRGPAYGSRVEFEKEVGRSLPGWEPAEVVLRRPRLCVRFLAWEPGADREGAVDLASDNGEYFTAGELLYKIHNSVVGTLKGASNPLFEGLLLCDSRGGASAGDGKKPTNVILCLADEGPSGKPQRATRIKCDDKPLPGSAPGSGEAPPRGRG